MAKLSISRLLEASKLLQTKAGQELQELITFVNDLANQIVLALRQGLTFEDNVKCKVTTVTLTHQIPQVINSEGKQISGIIPVRIMSTTEMLIGLNWYIDVSNQLVLTPYFVTATDTPYDVKIIILYV